MNLEEIKQAVQEVKAGNAILIDVRTIDEWNEGHASDAINFDSEKILTNNELPDVDKNSKVYLHCRTGIRAGKVKEYLLAHGFTNVDSVGGLSDWLNAN